MTHRMVIAPILMAALLTAGCGRRAPAVQPPSPIVEADILFRRGLASFHEGTPEGYARASEIFRTATRAQPARCEYALNLVQSLLFLATEQLLNWEDYEPRQAEAGTVLNSIESGCVGSYESFVLRLRALIAGRGPTATDLINRAVDLDPNDAMNWLVLSYLDPTSRHLVTPEGSGRWIAMEHAALLQPESALIQYELGRTYQGVRGKDTEAREALERATELSPRHFRAYLGLAYSADDETDVEQLYRKVVEIAPNFLEGRLAFGAYYGALDEVDKAASEYSAALALNPRYDAAHFQLGLLFLQAERPNEAEQHFKSVIELNPGSYEAYYYLGNISYGRNDFNDAKARYDQALKVRVNYPEAEYGIGWVFRQQDQNDLAVAQFDKVIKMRPRYGDAYLSRGDIRVERRQLEEALEDYDKAIAAYEDQLKDLNGTIAFADAHSQSRVLQSEKKRAERDKQRTEALIQRARQYKADAEEKLQQGK